MSNILAAQFLGYKISPIKNSNVHDLGRSSFQISRKLMVDGSFRPLDHSCAFALGAAIHASANLLRELTASATNSR